MAILNFFFMFEAIIDFFTKGYFAAFQRQFRFVIEFICQIVFTQVSISLLRDFTSFNLADYETPFEMIIFIRLVKTLELLQEID